MTTVAALWAEMETHNIRFIPADPAKDKPATHDWRAECSCGWASPTGTGQGPAAEHWQNHLRAIRATFLGGAA